MKNYKDYKIGQSIRCIKLTFGDYIDDERLILNEDYIITDIDFHFEGKVCVQLKGPYYFHEEFVPIECFDDIVVIRDNKINEILS